MDASQITPYNSMTGKFTVIGSDFSEVLSVIEVRQGNDDDVFTEIEIRVEEENIITTEIDIVYGNKSDVLIEIQPYGWVAISASIEVRPHNRMSALYEIQEPPKITDILHPVKDAFTREKSIYQTINYGGTVSLNVGATNDDRFRSYLQFDFSNWNPFFVIIESKIRLHYSGTIPDGVNIELFTLNQVWQEYGITHVNRPNPIKLITNQFKNNKVDKYIEFEATNITEEWIKRISVNEGMILRYANENDGSFGYINFKSRESSRPPELLITYYDGRIYSGGRSQVQTEIFVWQKGDSDVLTEIEVRYSNKDKDIPVEIEVHKYEDPVSEVIEAEITVTKPNIWSEITVSIIDDDSILVEITPRLPIESVKLTEITVSKPYQFAEIEVKYKYDVPTEIEIQRYGNEIKLTEISVSREYLQTEIYVRPKNDILTEIEVQRGIDDEILTEISINRESVLTEILVRAIDEHEVNAEIEVAALGESEQDVEISISREIVNVEIEIRAITEDDIDTEITIRALDDDTVESCISISRPDTLTEITVTEYRDLEVVVEVKYREDVATEITVMMHNNIFVEIEAIPNSNIEVEISVSKPNIWTEIHIPFFGESSITVELTPRLLRVSDKDTIITVRSKGGAYAFII